MIVLDASMALSWIVAREKLAEARLSAEAAHVLEKDGALVPPLWYTEVLNGVLTAQRQGVAASQQVRTFLADLQAFPIEMDDRHPELVQSAVLALAQETNLTAYDAAYLELAMRKHAILATFDHKLGVVAPRVGVRIFGGEGLS